MFVSFLGFGFYQVTFQTTLTKVSKYNYSYSTGCTTVKMIINVQSDPQSLVYLIMSCEYATQIDNFCGSF